MRRMAWVGVLAVVALGACETDGSSDPGTAPTISALTSDKTTIAVGSQQNLTLGFQFTDPDGDVTTAHATITIDGVPPASAKTAIQGASGQTAGAGAMIVGIIAPKAGEITVKVELEDAAGNFSNELQTKVTAQ